MIRVTIVSPNPALRIGLREILSRQSDIQVIGETVDLASVNENETEVAVLASVSSARLLESKPAFAILFLTDDIQLRPLDFEFEFTGMGRAFIRCNGG